MRKSTRHIVAAAAVLGCSFANAEFARSEGTYSSKTLLARVILLDSKNGTVAASLVISVGTCSGSIAGIGKIVSEKLVISSYEKADNDACRVTIEFDKSWKKIATSENAECSDYHGSSCSWDGHSAVKIPE